jgi:hypothetical protein
VSLLLFLVADGVAGALARRRSTATVTS